MYCEKCLQ